MTPEILQERRIEAEVRRMHQLERCRSRARRRLAEEFPARYQEILDDEKRSLTASLLPSIGAWTTGEIGLMRRMASLGAAAIAEELGRSIATVKWKAKVERISLRRPGETRGHILGQARKASLTSGTLAALRSDVLNGEVNNERIDRRKREESICPRCGLRPQATINGWCEACDVKELTRAYEAEKALKAAERENDATRQEHHRTKERAHG